MTDESLRQAVIDELEWEPRVNAAGIRVAAENGVVTLTGRVGTYAEKSAAEKAAGRVIGTKAVVEELDVHYPFDPPSDTDIAHYARQALAWDVEVPKESVEVKVGRGWVTLLGIVDWYFQRDAAEKDIRRLRGVRGVSNDIEIRPQVSGVGSHDRNQGSAFPQCADRCREDQRDGRRRQGDPHRQSQFFAGETSSPADGLVCTGRRVGGR